MYLNIKHYIVYPTEHETSAFIKYAGTVLHYSEYVSVPLTLLEETCVTIFFWMFAVDILSIHFQLYASWVVVVHRCFKNTLQIKSEAVRSRDLDGFSPFQMILSPKKSFSLSIVVIVIWHIGATLLNVAFSFMKLY
jgi:hypothetical protein